MRRKPVIRQPEVTSGNEKVGSMRFVQDVSGNFVLREMEGQEQSDGRRRGIPEQKNEGEYSVCLYVSDSLGRWIHGCGYSLTVLNPENGDSRLWGRNFEPGNHYHNGSNGWEEENGRKGVLEITGLPQGRYILKEFRNPPGFVPDDRAYPFGWETGGTQSDTGEKKRIEILKKFTKLRVRMRAPSGCAVWGAVMRLTGEFSDGSSVHTWVMTGEEYVLEGKLKTESTYILSEIKPPLGYELLRDPIQIHLDREGTVVASAGNSEKNTITISCRRSGRGGRRL